MQVEEWLGVETAEGRLEQLARLSFAHAVADSLDDLGHDLRSPLHNLAILLSLLQGGPPGPAVLDSARRLLDGASAKVESLLGAFDLPDLTRPEIGPLSLRDVVERVTPLWPLRRVFESRALEIDLPAGLPAASGDAAGLGHALLQLLRNAAEAAAAVSAGRVAVAVTHDEAMLWLSVADNGPGLAAPLERLREFGYSGWQGRRHLGVGLVLVHGLAQAMGARFELADGGPLGGAQARIGLPCWSG